MAQNAEQILATRDLLVYITESQAGNALPANTVAWGTAWGTPAGQTDPWADLGYTSGGLNFNNNVTRGEIRVDQVLDPVLRPATGRTAEMSTTLAQFTPANILTATGQGAVTTQAATTAARGYDQWDQTATVDDEFYSIGFDVKHQDDEPLRIVGWRGQTTGTPSFTITPDNLAGIPLTLTLLPDTTTSPARIMTIRDISPIAP